MIDFVFSHSELACEPEELYKVNRELNLAWELVEQTGANLFLTGRAGTGKTTFLRKLRELSDKRMVVLAPTGVAAINASGNTIHSFFQLPFAPYIPGKGFLTAGRKYLNFSKQKKRLISSLSLLVIDEISMVRPDILDAIDAMLRRLRNSSRPFGGLQLLLIGDLRQLAPVVREDEWGHLSPHYASPYFFESHALRRAGFQTVELSVVYRQSDRRFLDMLNAIRDGNATAGILEELNRRYIPGHSPAKDEGYIRLTTHNHKASRINDSRLSALPGHEFSYEAKVEGGFPESVFPVDRSLRLREGAQVMFVKNDTGSVRRFYNGLIGTVTSLSDEKICVRPLGDGDIIEVGQVEWENTRYSVNPSTGAVVQEVTGTFRQYPLQLAWAITIHKSQGMTFDRAIIDAAHSFAPGQTYVALSRCRSLEGLLLELPIPPHAVIVDSDVNDFIAFCANNSLGKEQLERLKNDYAHFLLGELFDFEPLRRGFDDFSRYVREYIVPLYPTFEAPLISLKERIANDLCHVASRFLESCRGKNLAIELSDPKNVLPGRIMAGCNYFLPALEDIDAYINSLPKDIENAEYASRLNNLYEILAFQLELKRRLLSFHSSSPFSVASYLQAKGREVALLDVANPRSGFSNPRRRKKEATAGKPAGSPTKKPKGYSWFLTLDLFRGGMSIGEIARHRGLTDGTVCKHIVELIKISRIDPKEIADEATVEIVARKKAEMPSLNLPEFVAALKSDKSVPPIPYNVVKILHAI